MSEAGMSATGETGMSETGVGTTGVHIVALYEDAAAAEAARTALIAAGVSSTSIIVLDQGYAARPAESEDGLWGILKHALVPDDHAHAYAEGVARGHALVLADVSETDTEVAVVTLRSSGPVDIDTRANEWTKAGWNGVNGGQDYWLDAQADRDAAGSEGITGSGFMSGDYGAVGAPHDGRVDTNILRGFSPYAGRREDGVLLNDDPSVRIYQVG
jgi:hypothetical protein